MPLRAITFDLDNTLWPIEPVIRAALSALEQWLEVHAPRVAARYTIAHWNTLRLQIEAEYPERAHDFSFLRLRSIERALTAEGYDGALAQQAFDVFHIARHRVDLYDDVTDALERLARRFPLAALTNGTADVNRLPIGRYFSFTIHARSVAAPKPHAIMFDVAAERFGAEPAELLHVGDSHDEDVRGALGAGWQAAWLVRGDQARHPDVPTFRTLTEFADHVDRVAGRIGAE